MQSSGGPWQRFGLDGKPITAQQAHPGNPSAGKSGKPVGSGEEPGPPSTEPPVVEPVEPVEIPPIFFEPIP